MLSAENSRVLRSPVLIMLLVPKGKCLSLQSVFLLLLCSALEFGSAVGSSTNATHVNDTSVFEGLEYATSSWTTPSLNTAIVWPSPTVTILPPGNLTLVNEPSVQSDISRVFIKCSCTPAQKVAIVIAWIEAKQLIEAVRIPF